MKYFQGYLSTAPVYGIFWCGLIAGLIIEVNRFFPDGLIFPFF